MAVDVSPKKATRFQSHLLAIPQYAINHIAFPINATEHLVAVRRLVYEAAFDIMLNVVDQTKLVTAASELARNTIKYGGGGDVHILRLSDGVRYGVQLMFADDGPGISDIELALTDGYTTGGGLGLGLPGSRRLVDEFELDTRVTKGTVILVRKWRR